MKTKARALKATALTALLFTVSAQAVRSQETARSVDDKEAKVMVAAFKKELKASKKSMRKRVKAVQVLASSRNALLVKPLLSVAKKDKSKTVRAEAAIAIGNQPKKKARPALTSLLAAADPRNAPTFTASVIKAISSSCYERRDWKAFQSLFTKHLTTKQAVSAQYEILQAAAKHKEIDALDFLVEHIDAPEPAWVDDPNNPGSEYWKARWENWAKWAPRVKHALYEITGQRFGTGKEARIWLKRNRRTLERERREAEKKAKAAARQKKKKKR